MKTRPAPVATEARGVPSLFLTGVRERLAAETDRLARMLES
jgi:hypothetical protein